MRVSVQRPLPHLCPHKDEVDVGNVTANWDGETVELHAFAAHLDNWAHKVVSHEALTEAVADYLKSQGASDVTVITRWSTAGFDVGVTA